MNLEDVRQQTLTCFDIPGISRQVFRARGRKHRMLFGTVWLQIGLLIFCLSGELFHDGNHVCASTGDDFVSAFPSRAGCLACKTMLVQLEVSQRFRFESSRQASQYQLSSILAMTCLGRDLDKNMHI